jgi:hypothetical protein
MNTSPAFRAYVPVACASASVASRRLTAQPAAARGGQLLPQALEWVWKDYRP